MHKKILSMMLSLTLVFWCLTVLPSKSDEELRNLSKVEVETLFEAIEKGQSNVVKQLLMGGKLDSKDEQAALFDAMLHGEANHGNYEIFNFLLDRGADPSPVLYTAVFVMDVKNFEALLKHPKINPNGIPNNICPLMLPTTHDGSTPLIFAVKINLVDHVKLLLDHPDIDPNIRDSSGWTALHNAVRLREGREVVELLLQHKNINLDLRNEYGNTPLHMATRTRWFSDSVDGAVILNMLLKAKSFVQEDGETVDDIVERERRRDEDWIKKACLEESENWRKCLSKRDEKSCESVKLYSENRCECFKSGKKKLYEKLRNFLQKKEKKTEVTVAKKFYQNLDKKKKDSN